MKTLHLLCILAFGLGCLACTPTSRPIEYGAEYCAYCKMTVVDQQHAAQVRTLKGRTYSFDAIECMLQYVQAEGEEQFAELLVCNYAQPGTMIAAGNSTFLISPNIPSPMGAYLSAFGSDQEAEVVKEKETGNLYNWTGLKQHFSNSGWIQNQKY